MLEHLQGERHMLIELTWPQSRRRMVCMVPLCPMHNLRLKLRQLAAFHRLRVFFTS